MNSLEAEYSFLAPTWRLPSVVTPSIYSRSYGTSYLSSVPNVGPDWSLWNNTAYNGGYIPTYTPSSTLIRNYPLATNYGRSRVTNSFQRPGYPGLGDRSALSGPPFTNPGTQSIDDGLNLTISLHPNNEFESYSDMPRPHPSKNSLPNRGQGYAKNPQNTYVPPNPKRRVQIVDNNRQTPSTVFNDNASGVLSRNSNPAPSYKHFNRTPDPHQSQRQARSYATNHNRDHLDDNKSHPAGTNPNIHEYLYGLSVPDPGSYTETFRHHQRRLQEEKQGRKSVMSDYKSFAKDGGFGPGFGQVTPRTYDERVENEKKRKSYAKVVHETNHYKIEEQKRFQNTFPSKNNPPPVPKYQRAREYADSIEKPQHTKPVLSRKTSLTSSIVSSLVKRSVSNTESDLSFDCILSSSRRNPVSNRFKPNSFKRSLSLSSIRLKQRVHSCSQNLTRWRSSASIDQPADALDNSTLNTDDLLSKHLIVQKLVAKVLNEKKDTKLDNYARPRKSASLVDELISNRTETKSITSHSMTKTKNIRLPPTANVVISQKIKPSPRAKTSVHGRLKKPPTNRTIKSAELSFIPRTIPNIRRQTEVAQKLNFDLHIKSCKTTDDKNSSNE